MLTKNLFKISALGISFLACASSYADDANNFLNPSSSYTPNYASSNAPLPQPAFASTNGFFIAVGGSYTYMKLPDFTYASRLTGENLNIRTSQPAYRFHNRVSTFMPSLTIGKYFYNNHFLPFLFGQTLGIKLEGSFWSDKSSDYRAKTYNAYFTPIDGSKRGDYAFFPEDQLENLQFTAKNRFWHGGLFLTGQAPIGRSRLAQFNREFRIGIIYNNLHQDFNFNGVRVRVKMQEATANRPEILQESTNTNYLGLQIGNTLTAQFNPNVTAFIKGDIALVRASTDFRGYQKSTAQQEKGLEFTGFEATASSSNSKVTYIADLGGGLTFHASGFPVNLTLGGGVQFLGYVPRVVNPMAAPGEPVGVPAIIPQPPAKVVGTSAINPYATLALTLPF